MAKDSLRKKLAEGDQAAGNEIGKKILMDNIDYPSFVTFMFIGSVKILVTNDANPRSGFQFRLSVDLAHDNHRSIQHGDCEHETRIEIPSCINRLAR